MKARQAILFIALLLLVSAAGLSDTLTIAVPSDYEACDTVRQLVYEGLTRLNSDLELVPGLADSWSTEGGYEWVFHLRDGMSNHDAEPLLAEEAIRILEEDYPLNDVLVGEVSMSAEDELTLRIELEYADHYLPYKLALLPIQSTRNLDEIVGTGTYRLVESVPGDYLRLERFNDYWGPDGPFDSIVLKIVNAASSQMMMLETAEVDVVLDASIHQYLEGQRSPLVKAWTLPSRSSLNLEFNVENELFSDARIRKAIAHCIDRHVIVDEVYGGLGDVCKTALHPEYISEPGESLPEFNPAMAISLLEDAGWNPSEVKFQILVPSNISSMQDIALAIREYLSQIGMSVEVVHAPYYTYSERLRSGEFDVVLVERRVGFPFPNMDYLTTDAYWNASGFSHPTVDMLVDSLLYETVEHRESIYKELNDVLVQEMPCVWLLNPYPFALSREGFSLESTPGSIGIRAEDGDVLALLDGPGIRAPMGVNTPWLVLMLDELKIEWPEEDWTEVMVLTEVEYHYITDGNEHRVDRMINRWPGSRWYEAYTEHTGNGKKVAVPVDLPVFFARESPYPGGWLLATIVVVDNDDSASWLEKLVTPLAEVVKAVSKKLLAASGNSVMLSVSALVDEVLKDALAAVKKAISGHDRIGVWIFAVNVDEALRTDCDCLATGWDKIFEADDDKRQLLKVLLYRVCPPDPAQSHPRPSYVELTTIKTGEETGDDTDKGEVYILGRLIGPRLGAYRVYRQKDSPPRLYLDPHTDSDNWPKNASNQQIEPNTSAEVGLQFRFYSEGLEAREMYYFPLAYIEYALWEADATGEDDRIGFYSNTIRRWQWEDDKHLGDGRTNHTTVKGSEEGVSVELWFTIE